MTKTIKAFAILGVVAGLGVAALPLSSYAADPSQDIKVQLTLDDYISCEMSKDAESTVTITDIVNNGAAQTNSTSINVKTNSTKGYKVTIKSKTSETALVNTTEGVTASIPALGTAVATIPTGESAWGYKGGDITNFTGVTATDATLKTSEAKATSNDGDDIEVTFGAAASASQAPGTYEQTVVLTAAVNNA